MSGRAVRKALKKQQRDELQEIEARVASMLKYTESDNGRSSDDNGNESGNELSLGGPVNPFTLLDEEASLPSSMKSKRKQRKKKRVQVIQDQLEENEVYKESKPVHPKKSHQKSKSKKKSGAKNEPKHKGQAVSDMTMDEFEQQIEQAKAKLGGAWKENAGERDEAKSSAKQESQSLLVIDPKNLDPDREMQRLFGSQVVQSTAQRRIPAQRFKRKFIFARPSMTWPPYRQQTGLQQIKCQVDDKDNHSSNVRIFKFTHSPKYQEVQKQFLASIALHDAEAMAIMVHTNPYHVDALLQQSEIIKQTGGDFGQAGELIERALFSFENAFLAQFNPTSGSCRLDFRYYENRSFYLTLSKQVQFLMRRGCWRTAFEFNKMLISLDPEEDPTSALLIHDFLALKSKQYEYVADFKEKWNFSKVDHIPSWAYSHALAQFMIESKKHGEKNHRDSIDLLVKAILKFPTIIPPLFSKISLEIPSEIVGYSYFEPKVVPTEKSKTWMELMVDLFIEYNVSLYKVPEVSSWLQEGLMIAMSYLEDPNSLTNNESILTSHEINDLTCTYLVSKSISRHILIFGHSHLMSGLPESITSQTHFDFDPIPPEDDINPYEEFLYNNDMLGASGLRGIGLEGLPREGAEAIVRLLRRFIPWAGGNNPQADRDGDDDNNDDDSDSDSERNLPQNSQAENPDEGSHAQGNHQAADEDVQNVEVQHGFLEQLRWLLGGRQNQGEMTQTEREWIEAFDAVERAEADEGSESDAEEADDNHRA
ncbi:hypothetical protein H4219_002083 [Mycoemilia scoparia]|uniref:DUF654-domain-containing protein n=1 Tax=Mycoemilia scoparia TaxID=417184 RepID=A0A9W8A7S3_9FUNG|nr:hypothetical protein H4219_002083 [Mycoemilia scoparia]